MRWKKARDGWSFELRDVLTGVAALVVALIVLRVAGFDGGVLAEVAIVGGVGVAVALFVSLVQLASAWSKAPLNLLAEDVAALEQRLDQMGANTTKVSKVPTAAERQVAMMNAVRLGEEAINIPEQRAWADDVVGVMQQLDMTEELREFLPIRSFAARLAHLKTLDRRLRSSQ